ncbi:hypothetical protein [Ectobacillus polymachus]|uniref:hypothetical protein n=1 Tax=Ectobacillus polymachus TaxID=1508806 RepID=UPI003A8A7C48
MVIVSKEKVVTTIDELLSTLDLLEMQVTLRVNHVLKNKENEMIHTVEIIESYVGHMETKQFRNIGEGNWGGYDSLAV